MNDVNIFDADLMDAEKDEEVLDSFHGIFLYIDGGIRFSSSTSTFFILGNLYFYVLCLQAAVLHSKTGFFQKAFRTPFRAVKTVFEMLFFPSRPPSVVLICDKLFRVTFQIPCCCF